MLIGFLDPIQLGVENGKILSNGGSLFLCYWTEGPRVPLWGPAGPPLLAIRRILRNFPNTYIKKLQPCMQKNRPASLRNEILLKIDIFYN